MSFEGTEGSQDDLSTLADVAGLWPAVYTQTPDPMLPEAPKEELGPKLVITWRLPDGGPTPGFVRAGPLPLRRGRTPDLHPAGPSRSWAAGRTTGGWFRTPTALQPRWETLGLPTKSHARGRDVTRRSPRPRRRRSRTHEGGAGYERPVAVSVLGR